MKHRPGGRKRDRKALPAAVVPAATVSAATMASVSMAEFISTLFEFTEGDIYFSSLPNVRDDPQEPGERHVLTRDVGAVERFIARWDGKGRALYFCVSTIAGKRNKANAIEIAGLFTDSDFKTIAADEAEIRQALQQLRCPPTMRVHSGHGFHSYWMFNEPLPLHDDGNLERVEAALRQLADHVAGDLSVCEVARLMRLPGSHNSKGDSWREVTVEHIGGPRYELDDLEEWLAETAPVLHRRSVSHPSSEAQSAAGNAAPDNPFLAAAKLLGFKPPVDVEARLEAMAYGGAGDSSIHATQLSVSASLLNAGREIDEVEGILMEATRAAAGALGVNWNWRREAIAIRKMCETWLQKHPRIQPERENAVNLTADRGEAEEPATEDSNVTDLGLARAKRKPKRKPSNALHIILGEALLAVLEGRGERVMFTDKGSYRYRDGLWWLETDPGVQGWLDTELEACARGLSLDSASRLINEARKWIVRNPDLRREGVAFDAHGMVPTLSGLADPYSGTSMPTKPEHYVTWRAPYKYDAAATCPLWLEMLDSAFADRADEARGELIALVQELAGAGLVDIKSKALSKALVFWGSQDTGKSGLIEVISGLYGEEKNTTPLAALDDSHGTIEFIHRRPWVLHEAFEQSVWHLSSSVKSIISGDPININIKHGPMLSRRFRAPVVWGTNHAPKFKEATKAIIERMVVICCSQQFQQDNPTGVAKKAKEQRFDGPGALVLATEADGVLAWAMAGLRRALERGHFVLPAEVQEVARDLRIDSNMVAGFVEDCLDYDPDGMVPVPDFVVAFKSWWLEHKGEDRLIPSSEKVSNALRALGNPMIAIHAKELRDNSRRYYAGVSLNTDGLRHWRNAVTSEAFEFQGRKASTTDPGGNPFKTIPRDWGDRMSVRVMRAAHRTNRHAASPQPSPAMTVDEARHQPSPEPSPDQPPERPDGIYF